MDTFEKQHLKHCILFVFQFKKYATEATQVICFALDEDAIKRAKSDIKIFGNRQIILQQNNAWPRMYRKENEVCHLCFRLENSPSWRLFTKSLSSLSLVPLVPRSPDLIHFSKQQKRSKEVLKILSIQKCQVSLMRDSCPINRAKS